MATVEITGWRPGFNKAKHTKTLQEYAGLSLSDAKKLTDNVMDGKAVSVAMRDGQGALHLAERLNELGSSAKVNQGSGNAI